MYFVILWLDVCVRLKVPLGSLGSSPTYMFYMIILFMSTDRKTMCVSSVISFSVSRKEFSVTLFYACFPKGIELGVMPCIKYDM